MSSNPFTSRQFQSVTNDQQRPQNGLSYVSGATQGPLRFITIPTLLDEVAMNHGSRDAVIFAKDREHLSWHDLKRRSDEVAAGLLSLGIQRGDKVGWEEFWNLIWCNVNAQGIIHWRHCN